MATRSDGPSLLGADEHIRAERLKLLYHQSAPAVAFSLASATVFALLFWPYAEKVRVVVWLVLLGLASLARLGLFVGYRRRAPSGHALLSWERPYQLTLVAASLVWGLGLLWITPGGSEVFEAITVLFLVGMAGGALASYSAHRKMANATILILLAPACLWLLYTGERTSVLLAVGLVIFFASAVRSTALLSHALSENFQLAHALREAKEAAERLASTDVLTGLLNRRAFLDQAAATFHFCRRGGLPVAAMMVDIDHFKAINDSRSHAVGDIALQHVARLIASSLRKSDLPCRWGGEEFVVFLPDTLMEEALMVGEKLREAIASTQVPVPRGDLSLTASIGVASGDRDIETLVDHADAAMYRAKREGRNRVSVAELAGPAGAVVSR